MRTVSRGQKNVRVFNLSVNEDESYVADGIIVHNCTHHSIARGGKPCSDQSRASAWHVLHWAERLQIQNILIENVREFQKWGPLNSKGQPIKSREGETFNAFLTALNSLGYRVDFKILNAADYGDATTRRRLFIQARKAKAISWPHPTHSDPSRQDMFAGKPWRAAREVIDWGLEGQSIFRRKRPLSPRTLKRIEAGLRKFCGLPFVLQTDQTGGICASGKHQGLCEPFLVECSHGGDRRPRGTGEPLPTITCGHKNGDGRNLGLCQPYLVKFYRTAGANSVNEPLDTVTTKARFGLVEPFICSAGGPDVDARPVSQPMNTVLTRDHMGLVQPIFLQDEQGNTYLLDIRFRMLQPHELAMAMGFEGYEFTGNKSEQVKQIGNAVPVNTAEALCTALLS